MRISEDVAAAKEVDLFQLLLHASFFFIRHIVEGRSVLPKVQADELHDTLPPDDVPTEVADHIDHLLGKVLQLACLLNVTTLPSIKDPDEATTVVVGGTSDPALCTSHS